MDQIRTFTDERILAFCAYCGGQPVTRDHVPPRVFLDQPYPANLPVVGCCAACNSGASLDEEYVACLLEVIGAGSVTPEALGRSKIARILAVKPALAARLAEQIRRPRTGTSFVMDVRVVRVVEKIARGLWLYEVGESTLGLDAVTWTRDVAGIDRPEQKVFPPPPLDVLLPEVGSRMLSRILLSEEPGSRWTHAQRGRFSYSALVGESQNRIEMIIGDNLAAMVEFR